MIIKNLIESEKFQDLIKDAKIVHEQALIYKEEVKVLDLLLYKMIDLLWLIIKLLQRF